MPYKKVLAILLAMAVIIAGGLSLVASSFMPDGLEWSISKITGATEVESTGGIYSFFAGIQDKLAILPDYGFKSSGHNCRNIIFRHCRWSGSNPVVHCVLQFI
ncbi:MAG: PDGLE domain-containing protein [Eubacterium sp.]